MGIESTKIHGLSEGCVVLAKHNFTVTNGQRTVFSGNKFVLYMLLHITKTQWTSLSTAHLHKKNHPTLHNNAQLMHNIPPIVILQDEILQSLLRDLGANEQDRLCGVNVVWVFSNKVYIIVIYLKTPATISVQWPRIAIYICQLYDFNIGLDWSKKLHGGFPHAGFRRGTSGESGLSTSTQVFFHI